MKKNVFLVSLATILLYCSCNTEDSFKPHSNEDIPVEKPVDTLKIENPKEENIFNNEFALQKYIELPKEQEEISQRLNTFAWKLFINTYKQKGESNLVLSPFSLTQDLLMLCNGLKGITLEDTKQALGLFYYNMEAINQYVLLINQGLNDADPKTKYRTDNSIWYRNDMTINDEFAQNIEQYYKADLFIAAMDSQTVDSINDWAYEKTFGRIKRMLTKLPEHTNSVLMNTVYFRGLWQWQMEKEDIRDGIFINENGEKEPAKMMDFFRPSYYADNTCYQATSREYSNGAFIMDFILPKEGVASHEALAQYIEDNNSNIRYLKVNLVLPCFDAESELTLNQVLSSMGMTSIFSPASPLDVQLFDTPTIVSQVLQKANITVNEKGTEAAVATAIISVDGNCNGEKTETIDMVLNRPFFYAIRETSTNTPLFIGYQGSVK